MSSPEVQIEKRCSKAGLAYLTCGSASSDTACIYIHGWSCQASDYTSLLQIVGSRLPKLRHVAIDLPGHGDSDRSICPVPSVPAFAEIILDTIHELNIRAAVLVGHSMSCRMVLQTWSLTHTLSVTTLGSPDVAAGAGVPLVKGIVLLDGSHFSLRSQARFAEPSHDVEHGSNQGIHSSQKASKTDFFENMFSASTPEAFKVSTRRHLFTRDAEYSSAVREAYMRWDVESVDSVVTLLGACDGPPLLQLQSTDVDALNLRRQLVMGDDTAYMAWIRRRVPRVEQVVVEDAGHFVHVDQPKVVADLLGEFIGRVLG